LVDHILSSLKPSFDADHGLDFHSTTGQHLAVEMVLIKVEVGFLFLRSFIGCHNDEDVSSLIDVGLHKPVGALYSEAFD
jgi:hypothetical protein